MDIWTIIVGASVVAGLLAAILQMFDFTQKLAKRIKKREKSTDKIENTHIDEKPYLHYLVTSLKAIDQQFSSRSLSMSPSGVVGFRPEMEVLLQDTTAKETVAAQKLYDVVLYHRKIVLVGEAGSGKTTMMQKLAYEQAQKALADEQESIPVFIRMGDFVTGEGFLEFLIRYVQSQAGNWAFMLRDLLSSGKLWLILDGLDEMPLRDYKERIEKIRFFIEANSNNVIVISCRDSQYEGEIGFDEVSIQPLNPEEIRGILANIKHQSVDEIIQFIEENHFEEISKNPYFLKMLTLVYQEEGQFIGNSNELLAKFIHVLLKRERRYIKQTGVDTQELTRVLAHIAFGMAILSYRRATVSRDWIVTQIPVEKSELNDSLRFLWGRALLFFTRKSRAKKYQRKKIDSILDVAIRASILSLGQGENTVQFYHQLIQDYFNPFILNGVSSLYPVEELIIDRIENSILRLTSYQRKLICDAYQEAAYFHKNENRASDDPYIIHPVASSIIAAQVMDDFDLEIIIGTLLHDSPADKPEKLKVEILEKIQEKFGTRVHDIVLGILRWDKKAYELVGPREKLVAPIDELILSTLQAGFSKEVIFVKLCERLHNIQTVQFIKPTKKKGILEETRLLYVPLAFKIENEHIAELLQAEIEKQTQI